MNIVDILQNEFAPLIGGGLAGVITAWFTQRVLSKRGTFTYVVNHNRVGMSTDDAIFGNVKVTWNDTPIANLYLSTVELKNESMNDYENVVVKAYTNNTNLLSEQTQIIDTPNILEHSDKYKELLNIKDGESPTDEQFDIYNRQREYLIPIMNRGQAIKLTYLNAAKTTEIPSIWLSVIQKGVKLRFKPPQNEILGVPQPRAAFAGLIIGLIIVCMLVAIVDNPLFMSITAFTIGLVAQVPGAYTIKALRVLREIVGG